MTGLLFGKMQHDFRSGSIICNIDLICKDFSMASCSIDKGFFGKIFKDGKMRGQSFSGDNSKKSRAKFQFSRFYGVTGDLMLEMIMSKMRSNDEVARISCVILYDCVSS